MPANLTNTKIKDTFPQLLHVDGGPEASPKIVYSGTGTATALRLGTGSVEVDNIRVDGNTISTLDTNGSLILSPNGTGTVTIANVNITGGTITGVSFPGSFTGITLIESLTFATGAVTAGCNLNGNTLAADGTDTNIDINLVPKGAGAVNVSNINITSGAVPFGVVTQRAYGQFSSTQDQTAAANTPTAVTFNASDTFNSGITVASNSRITFAAAGDYEVYFNLQFINAENADHEVTVWLRLNGTDIANSATRVVVPASSVGGTGFFDLSTIVRVTAGQYVEVIWAAEDADVSLNYEAAEPSTPFTRPAIPSAILTAHRIG